MEHEVEVGDQVRGWAIMKVRENARYVVLNGLIKELTVSE